MKEKTPRQWNYEQTFHTSALKLLITTPDLVLARIFREQMPVHRSGIAFLFYIFRKCNVFLEKETPLPAMLVSSLLGRRSQLDADS